MGSTFQAAPQAEQDRLAIPVLEAALVLVRRGWCRGYVWPADFGATPVCWSLVAALNASGYDTLEIEYARRLLRRMVGTHDLVEWNDHPTRRRAGVVALLTEAIHGSKPKRTGGWGWSNSADGSVRP